MAGLRIRKGNDQSSQICLQSVKKSPSLQHSRKYIAGESALSPGKTTSYSGRNDSRSGRNDSGRTGHRAKRPQFIACSVLMALVFYYNDMLQKVTMQRTQHF